MTPPKTPSVLETWKEEAKIPTASPRDYYTRNERILALIDLVEKKDDALKRISTSYSTFKPPSEIASEALALTADLK